MKAELLAPAGSFESMKAAVAAGADAVYVGGARFGARAYADNFTEEQLLEAVDYCHLHSCRLYLTVNTLLKDQELEELYDYLLPYYKQGLDAVIVQDMGVLLYIRQAFPDLDIHASTQMTLCGPEGARLLQEAGASRIVTSRELSLEEIKAIRRESTLEIESFVHGALCYCYSGQCLLSSMIGGRSGNRGRCAQPCRLPYKMRQGEGFLLSPKDICTLELLPRILEAGVYSLKIEGRMKRAEYTAGVVRIYRKYLDMFLLHGKKNYKVSEEDKRQLMALYNRGGFSSGYYLTHNGKEMMSMKRANHFGTKAARVLSVQRNGAKLQAMEELHKGDILETSTVPQDVKQGGTLSVKLPSEALRGIKAGQILHRTRDAALLSELHRLYIETERKEKINGNLRISSGQPAILNVNLGRTKACAKGALPQPSISQPLRPEKLKTQLEKTGNTPFVFDHLEIEAEDGLFLPLQAINELRRDALDKLERKLTAAWNRKEVPGSLELPAAKSAPWTGHRLYGSAETWAQGMALAGVPGLTGVFLDWSAAEMPLTAGKAGQFVSLCHEQGKTCYYIFPHIFRKEAREQYASAQCLQALELFDGVLFRNYEEYVFLRDHQYSREIRPDFCVYTFNRWAREFWRQHGVEKDTAPLELNDRELAKRGCGHSQILVYGHLPVMVSAQCLRKNTEGCSKKSGLLSLRDRMGKEFPVKNNCTFCYNTIYNQVPLSLFDNRRELDTLKPESLRLSFTVESPEKTKAIAGAFVSKFLLGEEEAWTFGDFTRGHFKRGVE